MVQRSQLDNILAWQTMNELTLSMVSLKLIVGGS